MDSNMHRTEERIYKTMPLADFFSALWIDHVGLLTQETDNWQAQKQGMTILLTYLLQSGKLRTDDLSDACGCLLDLADKGEASQRYSVKGLATELAKQANKEITYEGKRDD